MMARANGPATSDLGTASVVLLCMSVSAGMALAIDAVWPWVPWLVVAVAALIAVVMAAASRRASRDDVRPG